MHSEVVIKLGLLLCSGICGWVVGGWMLWYHHRSGVRQQRHVEEDRN